jgi:hypothetical protein
MKNMKYIQKIVLGLLISTSALLFSCEFDDQVDPNNPSIQQLTQDASKNELNNLVVGIESQMRGGLAAYVSATGTVARELYLFNADPRNTEDLLGKNGGQLDANTFYITAPYGGSYNNVKNANILIAAVDNTTLVSEAEVNGYKGFANTIKALQLLRVLNMLGENGIRVEVGNPDDLGPFLSQTASLTAISDLLDEALGQLSAAGSSFPFELSLGFVDFNTPATYSQFNRALAARVAIYREDWTAVSSLLNASFYAPAGDLSVGPKHSFSNASGDLLNGLFKIPGNNGDMIIVHNSFLDDAEAGDLRVSNKTSPRSNATSQDGLNGLNETSLYLTPTSSNDIIRNEELVLISAEAKLQTGDNDGAIADINIIRNAAGLADYSGANTEAAVTDELLNQRRYSLWCEGHRMVDLRRYGRLNEDNLPIDREGDQIFQNFPIPLTEAE